MRAFEASHQGDSIRYGLWFWFSAVTAYPFVISGLVHDPLIHASETAMVEQRFRCRVGGGVGVPQGDQFVGISIHRPAAVAHDSGSPVTFLVMMDAHPVMLASGRLGRSWFCRLC